MSITVQSLIKSGIENGETIGEILKTIENSCIIGISSSAKSLKEVVDDNTFSDNFFKSETKYTCSKCIRLYWKP